MSLQWVKKHKFFVGMAVVVVLLAILSAPGWLRNPFKVIDPSDPRFRAAYRIEIPYHTRRAHRGAA